MTAHEREAELTPRIDKAQMVISDLEAAVADAEQRAHDSYVRGDVPGGDTAHGEAAELKPQLEAARAHLAGMQEAAFVIAGQRQREQLEARRAAVAAALEESVNEAYRRLAGVAPAISAGKQDLQLADAAEANARRLAAELHLIDTELTGAGIEANGLRIMPQHVVRYNRVPALLERDRALRELLANPEY